jgi:hypothetical protein
VTQHDPQHDPHDEQDDDLRALLHRADPASSLSPADPDRVARLLEDTMTDPLHDESRIDGTRDRSPLTWLVAAAAVVLIAGGVLFAVARGDDEPEPPTAAPPASTDAGTDASPSADDPDPSTGSSDPAGTTTELTFAGGAVTGRCLPPDASPQVVAAQTTVFDGTVESISGRIVTLTPTRWYAGDETDRVVVRAPGAELEALLSAVSFEEGGRYLVAATDGQVTVCGFTGPYTDQLASLYEQAFPG